MKGNFDTGAECFGWVMSFYRTNECVVFLRGFQIPCLSYWEKLESTALWDSHQLCEPWLTAMSHTVKQAFTWLHIEPASQQLPLAQIYTEASVQSPPRCLNLLTGGGSLGSVWGFCLCSRERRDWKQSMGVGQWRIVRASGSRVKVIYLFIVCLHGNKFALSVYPIL